MSQEQEFEKAIPDILLISTRNKCILAVLLEIYDICHIKFANIKN